MCPDGTGSRIPIPRLRPVLRQREGGRCRDPRQQGPASRHLHRVQGLVRQHLPRPGGSAQAGAAEPAGPPDRLPGPLPRPLAGAGQARRGLPGAGAAQGQRPRQEHQPQQLRHRGLPGARRGHAHPPRRQPDRGQPLPLPPTDRRLLPVPGGRGAVVQVAPGRQGVQRPRDFGGRRQTQVLPGPDFRPLVPPEEGGLHPQVRPQGADGGEHARDRLRAG
mmetsp:Transcript_10211/g.29290  ORF Transcript_10211/g.29290 Transcript_10211/m.29290 type:complete len:219 (+) Transcript_10211:258-914(+)